MKKKREPRPLDVFAYNEFVDTYHKDSDRAAAVLAGGYLDSFLEGALRSVLVKGKRVDDLFDGQGVLGSLASKISLAYALGLVPDALARDMDLVRKIRNHFAHHIWEATFDVPPVSDWCKEIAIVDSAVDQQTGERVKLSGSLRIRYLIAVGWFTMMIAHSPKVPASFREQTTGIPEELRIANTGSTLDG